MAQKNRFWEKEHPVTQQKTQGGVIAPRSAYDRYTQSAIDNTLGYAQYAPGGKSEVADTLTKGSVYKPDSGDIGALDRNQLRSDILVGAEAIAQARDRGIFNARWAALDPRYSTLPQTDYMEMLLGLLQGELADSQQKDEAWANGGQQEWYDFLTRQTAVQNKIADMDANGRNYYDMDSITEEDLLWFDQFINGNDRWKPNIGFQEDVDRLNAIRDQWASVDDWENFDLASYLGITAPTEYKSKTGDIESGISTIERELKNRQAANELEAAARASADFGQYSAFSEIDVDYSGPNARLMSAYVQGYDNPYNFVNADATWADKKVASEHSLSVQRYLDEGYDFLLPEEIEVYNYYYQKGELDKAAEYLEAKRSDLLYRRHQYNEAWTSAKASNPWLAFPTWVDARINGLLNVAAVPLQMIETATGRDNPYSSAYDFLNEQSYVTDTHVGMIQDAQVADWVKEIGTTAYLGGSSAMDNFARLLATGFNPAGSLIIAGLQSTSHSLQESSERDDMSAAAKIIKAIGTGAIEMGTEKIGLDELFSAGKRGALQQIKSVILAELGEESLNYISEPALEAVVAFLFEHEADIKSGPEFWEGLTDTWLQTAVSSLLMGGGSAYAQNRADSSTGKSISKTGDLGGVVDFALELSPDSVAHATASEIKAKTDSGKKVGFSQYGKLFRQIEEVMGAEVAETTNSVYDKAIENRLIELGTPEATAKKNAPIVRKLANDQKLTLQERSGFEWDDNVKQVVQELSRDVTVSEENAPGTIEDVGAEQVDGKWVAGDVEASEQKRTGNSWKHKLAADLGVVRQESAERDLKLSRVRYTDKAAKSAAEKGKQMVPADKKLKPEAVSFSDGDNSGEGKITKFEQGKGNKIMAVIDNGDGTAATVPVESINAAGNEGLGTVISYIKNEGDAKHRDLDAQEASTMLNVYNAVGGDAQNFIQDFETSYLSGYAGIENTPVTTNSKVAELAYNYGKESAKADEGNRAKTSGKAGTGATTWVGRVNSSEQIGKAAPTETLEQAMEHMTEAQQVTVKVAQALAKKMKIDIAFYESDPNHMGEIENGSFVPGTNQIYIDINSGVSTQEALTEAKKHNTLGYAILRTMAHELTHYMENNSSEGYAAYKQAVKDALKAKGVDWSTLVRSKIDTAIRHGQKLTIHGAEAEVIADASEYMLQDSKFIKELDTDTVSKIKTFIQDFMERIRNAFKSLMGSHIESDALRDVYDGVKKYSQQLQDLWDAGMELAIERVQSGEMSAEAVELSDANTEFSIREEDPPKKTGIAYKVFFEKNGKLYPPMVANPGGADTPVGVWLNADVGTAAPPSKTGRLQVKAGGKGTQGGSGSLAFRPGWHLGDIPKATQFNRLNKATGVKELFPYNFVWAECEYAMDVDYQEEAMSYGYNANGKFQHSLAGLPRLPENGYYHYRTNPDPNTVPWVITGAMKVNKILSRAEVDEILREKGVEPTKWQGPDGEQMEADGEVKQFSSRYVGGQQVVWINENILDTIEPGKGATAFVKEYIKRHIGEVYTIIESGSKVYIGDDLPGEYTHSNYTDFIAKSRPQFYSAKLRAASELGEMIEIATNRRWERTEHTHNKDAKYGVYKYDTKFAFPKGDKVYAYSAELVIINSSDGKKYLYDVQGIKKDTTLAGLLSSKESWKSKNAPPRSGDAFDNSVSHPTGTVNTSSQKSLRDTEYMDAVNSGNMVKAQQMVDEAAKRAGYETLKLFHGTSAFGFTKVDVSKSDDYLSFFATNNPDVAAGYFPPYFDKDSGKIVNADVKEIGKPGTHSKALQSDATVTDILNALSVMPGEEHYKGARVATDADRHEALKPHLYNLQQNIDDLKGWSLPYTVEYYLTDIEYAVSKKNYSELVELAKQRNDFNSIPYDTLGFHPYNVLSNISYAMYQVEQTLVSPGAYVPDGGPGRGEGFYTRQQLMSRYNDLTAGANTGIYQLYASNENQLVIHTGGANWNRIRIPENMRTGKLEGLTTATTREFAEWAWKNGYDSIKFEDLYDNGAYGGNDMADIYAFFANNGPSMIKSADPVTYDDNGNVIPLSERFAWSNEDIRYSLREDGNTDFVSSAMEVTTELENPAGQKLFSWRSMTEDYDTYRNMLIKAGTPAEEISALFNVIDEVLIKVDAHKDILDFGRNIGRNDRSFSPVKPNSDSLYKVSLDFSSLCRKRLLQQAVQERLEAKYNTVLTKAERVAIRNALMELREQGKQIEVACALCYVESTRLKSPAQIQRFFDDRRAVMVDYFAKKNKAYMKQINAKANDLIVKFGNEPGTTKKSLNKFQKDAVENLKRDMYKSYQPTAEEEAIIKTAMELPGESYRSAAGLWALKRDHEVIFDAYTSYVRNATKSKGIEADEAWWAGDSKKISNALIKKMNAENGLRSQSWSDFQVIHLLDYMAAIIELSTRNAKMQTYTKVPDFVKLMGDTGIMINLSLIPQGFDGTLNYDPIEGMPIEEALMLRELFPDTAGTICIGITDGHIRMLLANNNIDYVIPYHASSLDKETRQKMGMKVWDDFTEHQNEKEVDYPSTVKGTKTYHKKTNFSDWFDYKTVSERAKEVGAEQAMREAADRYIELCHRRGLQEKFPQFANEANYWKLLIDRKMINQQTGEIINQRAVKPRFDLDRIMGILQGEVDRFAAQNKDFNEAIKRIDTMWADGEIQKAAKSKSVQDAVSAFDASVVVNNIVESAKELDMQDKQFSLRDLPDDLSVREYLMDADESVAATIEEKNALTIYQQRLREHAAASEAVMAAEAALVGKTGDELKQAKADLAAARARQKELYNRLIKVENTEHVQKVFDRSVGFIREEIAGKTTDQIAKTIANKEAKINTLTAELAGLKGAAKAQKEADIRAQERIVRQLKSDSARKMLAMSERYQQAADEIRTRRDMNLEIAKKAKHIKGVIKRLNDRIIHEGDYKNVKEDLKPAVHSVVRAFIDGFGSLVFDSKQADKLRRVYDLLAKDGNESEWAYSDDVARWIDELAALSAQDEERRMSGGSSMESVAEKLETYEKLVDIADHIYHLVKSADEMFVNGKKEQFSQYSAEVGNELIKRKDKGLYVGAAGKALNIMDDLIRRGNMTPVYFFENLKNNGLKRLYDNLMDGQRKYAEAILAGKRFVAEAQKKYNYYTWSRKPQTFKTQQGHTIALTVEQKMWVYATAKREAANELAQTHHLDQGGFRYDKDSLPKANAFKAIEGSNEFHKLNAKDVAMITDTLTAEQKAYADALVEFLSEDMAEYGNRASMELFGIKKYNEKYYFPFKTASDQRYQGSAAGSASTTDDARVKHSSFTHALTKGANTALVMGNFTDVVANHINLMSTYSSFVVPIESLNRVLNRKVNTMEDGSGNDVTIRSLIGRKYGDAAQKYIADLLKDMNGGPQVDNRGGLSGLMRIFKRSAVVGSLSVAVQQPTAYIRAFAYISPKYFTHFTGEGYKATWDKMMKYSGTAVIKDMGRFDVGMGKMADEWIANGGMEGYNVFQRGKFLLDEKGKKAMVDNYVDFLTAMPGILDQVTWTHLWKAVEAEQADLHPGMDLNSEEFLRAVGERFDEVVNHTQVYDSILSKSQNMRSKNPLTQMSTSFMAEPTLNWNLLSSAFTGGHGKAQAAKMVAATVLANVAAAAFAAAIGAWNKDDDERKGLEKYMASFSTRLIDNLNPATMIPFLSDLWDIFSGYEVERLDWSVVKDLYDYSTSFIGKIADGKELTWRDYENFVGSWANLTGIPAKNWSRDLRRFVNFLNTDHNLPTASSLKYTLYEEIAPDAIWASSGKAYCQRFVAAIADGDTREAYDLWEYMNGTKGVTQSSLETNIRAALKEAVQNGSITPEKATEVLRKYVPYKSDKDNQSKPQEWLKETN